MVIAAIPPPNTTFHVQGSIIPWTIVDVEAPNPAKADSPKRASGNDRLTRDHRDGEACCGTTR
eukprot:7969660-Pyramimonas_sp.AAC.1